MSDILFFLSLLLTAIVLILVVVLLLKRKTPQATGEDDIARLLREEFKLGRDENARAARDLRKEIAGAQKTSSEIIVSSVGELGRAQKDAMGGITAQINQLTTTSEQRLESIRKQVDTRLAQIQDSNEKKLDEMRKTVDERLQNTLEKRLSDSFKLVSERLEAVQRGLGEMKELANGVGDLQRVLTNVKARGTWGEVQLGALLELVLTPDQYSTNVQTKDDSGETVEYTVNLPGPDDDPDTCVWLPIDAKFPQEDYLRLVEASEAADAEAVQLAHKDLVRSIKSSAKDISEKYLNPPATTDFAIMFLPTEGLYAEVLRQPGIVEDIQQAHRVVIAGPTTLAALLNSLRVGFQTLAIEQRSSEVWQLLGVVKTEFVKFGEVLARLKKQLGAASNTIEKTETRTKAMERKLREVEQLPSDSAEELLDTAELDEDLEIEEQPEP